MPRFSYGATAPRTHFTVRRFSNHPAASLPRPGSYDAYGGDYAGLLEDDDQNGWNGCVGFATAQLVRYVVVRAGMTDPGQLSPWYVWDATKLQEYGSVESNSGVDPHDALTIVRNKGIPPLSAYPNEAQQTNESQYIGAGIEFYQCATLDELLNGMGTLGVPGDFCIAVYDDFETPNTDETVADPTGSVLGYHNILIRSYDDSRQLLRVHNQWRGWTKDNEATLTYAQARTMFSQAFIVTHPAIQSPADVFWDRWSTMADYAIAHRSVQELSAVVQTAQQWLPYLASH